jgi:hypothetical protein
VSKIYAEKVCATKDGEGEGRSVGRDGTRKDFG